MRSQAVAPIWSLLACQHKNNNNNNCYNTQVTLTTQITTFHKQKPNTDGDGDGDMNRRCSDKAVTLLESRGEKRAKSQKDKHSRCTHANMYLSLPPSVIKQTPNCVRVCVDCKCGLQVDAGQTAANVVSMCSRGSLPENVWLRLWYACCSASLPHPPPVLTNNVLPTLRIRH